jgi:hypothetical protein
MKNEFPDYLQTDVNIVNIKNFVNEWLSRIE